MIAVLFNLGYAYFRGYSKDILGGTQKYRTRKKTPRVGAVTANICG
jgi:hypothetical protein